MIIKNLEINNFVTHKKSVIDFSKNGSYYIYAENRDNKSMNANGSGKSLILDSISWGLFGKTIRGFKADNVIGKFGKSCLISQIWYDGNKYIKISRYRKHSKYRNRVLIYFSDDGINWKEDSSKETTQDSDKYISRLFKMDYNLFISGVVLTKPKGELNFCESQDSKRKDVLTKLLNLDWIDKALIFSKEKRLLLKEKLSKIHIKYESLKSKLISNKQLLSSYKEESINFIKNMNKELNDINDNLLLEYKEIEEKIDFNNKEIVKLSSMKDFEIKNIKKKKDNKFKLDKELNSLKEKLQKIENNISVGNQQINDLKQSITLLNNLENKQVHSQCPLCENNLKASEKLNLVRKLNSKLNYVEMDLQSDKEKRNNINNEIKKLNIDYNNIDISNDSIIRFDSKIENLNNDIQKLNENIFRINANIKQNDQKIIEIKKKNNPWKKKIFKLNNIIKKIRLLVLDLKSKRHELNIKLKDIEYAIEAFGNSGIKNDIISSKIKILESNINHYLSKITDGDIFVQLDNKVIHGQTERIGLLIQDNKKTKPLDYIYWSGGEKTRIRFAVEWSLNSILNAPMNLIIIDEGFDDLDITGINKILEIMKSQTDKNIICVSNRNDMKNIFNNSIKVILENECSSVIQKKGN